MLKEVPKKALFQDRNLTLKKVIKAVIKVVITVAIMTNLSCGERVVDSRLPAPNAGLL